MDLGDDPFSFAEEQRRGLYLEPMVEICFESDQKVGAFLRPNVAFWCLRGNEGFIRIFRKRGCVQGERGARHNELGKSLVIADVSA